MRAPNVCAFQVKNATGCTVVRSSRLPSTRQYTRPMEPASPELCLDESKFVVNRNCRVSDEAPVSPKITIVNNYVQRTKLRLHWADPALHEARTRRRVRSALSIVVERLRGPCAGRATRASLSLLRTAGEIVSRIAQSPNLTGVSDSENLTQRVSPPLP